MNLSVRKYGESVSKSGIYVRKYGENISKSGWKCKKNRVL